MQVIPFEWMVIKGASSLCGCWGWHLISDLDGWENYWIDLTALCLLQVELELEKKHRVSRHV